MFTNNMLTFYKTKPIKIFHMCTVFTPFHPTFPPPSDPSHASSPTPFTPKVMTSFKSRIPTQMPIHVYAEVSDHLKKEEVKTCTCARTHDNLSRKEKAAWTLDRVWLSPTVRNKHQCVSVFDFTHVHPRNTDRSTPSEERWERRQRRLGVFILSQVSIFLKLTLLSQFL